MVAFAENKTPKGGGRYNADAETQNYYVRNRYYAAHLGRWLTRDPIGYQGGINLYEYVQSSPVGNVDGEGLLSPNRGLPLTSHNPGGPLEPPKGRETSCTGLDTCAVLQLKAMVFIAVIASHTVWDLANPTGDPQARARHKIESGDYERGLERCFRYYKKKCRKPRPPKCPTEPAPAGGSVFGMGLGIAAAMVLHDWQHSFGGQIASGVTQLGGDVASIPGAIRNAWTGVEDFFSGTGEPSLPVTEEPAGPVEVIVPAE